MVAEGVTPAGRLGAVLHLDSTFASSSRHFYKGATVCAESNEIFAEHLNDHKGIGIKDCGDASRARVSFQALRLRPNHPCSIAAQQVPMDKNRFLHLTAQSGDPIVARVAPPWRGRFASTTPCI